MSTRDISLPAFSEEQMRVHRAGEALNRDGASPAGALDLLAAVVESRDWERLTDAKGRSFEGRFRDFVQARSPYGLGYDVDQLAKVLQLRHPHESVPQVAERMAVMRAEVERLLDGGPLAEPGEIGGGHGRVDDINSAPTKGGTDRSYLRRRLARDRPDLYEKVASGEMSAHAAAKQAGIVKPTASVRTDSPEKVAATLRRHMTPAQLRELRGLLDEEPDA